MVSETKEILKSDVIQKFEFQLRGLKPVGGKYEQVYTPVLEDKHISTIVSILEMYVNDIVRSSNMSEQDALESCITLHEDMTDWFLTNWDEIEPKRMTRDQIISAMTHLVYATWKSADKGQFRKDLFGKAEVQERIERPFR